MTKPILPEWHEELSRRTLRDPQIPLITNINGQFARKGEISNPKYWCDHFLKPVQFADSVQFAASKKVNYFLEIGGHTTLSSMGRRCFEDQDHLFLPSLLRDEDDWNTILETLSILYQEGFSVDWDAFDKPYPRKRVQVAHYPFQNEYYWVKPISGGKHIRGQSKQVEATTATRQPPTEPVQITLASEPLVMETSSEGDFDEILEQVKTFVNQVSGIRTDSIDEDANLFYMGMDSLTIVDLQNKINEHYGLQLNVQEIYEQYNTTYLLAQYIQQNATFQTEVLPVEREPVETKRKSEQTIISAIPVSGQPIKTPVTDSDIVTDIINQQLQVMNRQLELLSGTGQTPPQDLVQRIVTPPKSVELAQTTDFQPTVPVKVVSIATKEVNPLRGMIFVDDKLTSQQQDFIDDLIARYNRKTTQSRSYAQESRKHTADWIATLSYRKSLRDMIYPLVSANSQGAHFNDIDSNDYVDIAMGYGVHFFGHQPSFVMDAVRQQLDEGFELGPQTDLIGENARLVHQLTGVDRVVFTDTGTEAVMAAVRLARAVSGKNQVVIFNGSFHGTYDGILAYADGDYTVPTSPGTPPGMVSDLKVLTYGSADSLEYIRKNSDQIAAVMVEPVQSRRPGYQPTEFLRELRGITTQTSIALIFDEMVTGFRICPGGAQQHFGVEADIVTYGKLIGGGMPIGVVAGKSDYMDAFDGGFWTYEDDSTAPDRGTMVYGGTFCKHPLAMASTNAVLKYLIQQGPDLQDRVNGLTENLCERLNSYFEAESVPVRAKHFCSMVRFESFGKYDLVRMPIEMDLMFYSMIEKGIYTWERRICFLSTVNSDDDITKVVDATCESIEDLRKGGFPFRDDVPPSGGKKAPPPRTTDGELSILSPPTERGGRSDGKTPLLMSSAQQRLYVLSQFPGGEIGYHLTNALRFVGELDHHKIESILREQVRRHEALRTGFIVEDDALIRVIYDDVPLDLEVDQVDRNDLREYLHNFVTSFDLASPPLLHIRLVQVAPDEHILMLDTHHIAVDGFSLNRMMQEFTQLYLGHKLPDPMVSYSDYVRDEAEYLDSELYKDDENYWLSMFAGDIPVMDLPYDFPRPSVQSFTGRYNRSRLNESLTEHCGTLARETNTTLFTVLLSAFNVLLNRLTDQTEIVVGAPVLGRPSGKYFDVIGMFANTIPLRTSIKPDDTFRTYLDGVKTVLGQSFAHQQYPFERIVDQLDIERDLSRNALFSVLFVYEKADDRMPVLPGLELEEVDIDIQSSMFDLTFECIHVGGEIKLNIKYRTDLFEDETISRWREYFSSILEDVSQNPNSLIPQINLFKVSDARSQLSGETSPLEHTTIIDIFKQTAQDYPDNSSILFEGTALSYREVDDLSDIIASTLIERYGVGSGDLVGLFVSPNEHLLPLMIGVMKSGAALVPIDRETPVKRIQYIIEDSGLKQIISDSADTDDLDCKVIAVTDAVEDQNLLPLNLPLLHKGGKLLQSVEIAPDSPAYIIYTSGTTGNPKGVAIPHIALANYVQWFKT
ncbi:MAG: aminotransferase class III-fold pyridoxal phosphate-dependent enzyme, partial [Candidatus Electryoneaceae bacterium]|nr:aminotransferase class III-fold pyridoxal phosphate-dependent enzyme [Candidatus Electryoneaceae bacterium]